MTKDLVIKPFNYIMKYKNEDELHRMLHNQILKSYNLSQLNLQYNLIVDHN
jgi:hypothetical protein